MTRVCSVCQSASCYKWYTGPTCAPCYQAKRRLSDPAHVNALSLKSAKACRERTNREAARWRKNNPKKIFNIYLKRTYGITYGEYLEILDNQGGGCKICGSTSSGRPQDKRMMVDHDHATGFIRGILCHRCNAGLGYFKDSKELLLKAISYVNY